MSTLSHQVGFPIKLLPAFERPLPHYLRTSRRGHLSMDRTSLGQLSRMDQDEVITTAQCVLAALTINLKYGNMFNHETAAYQQAVQSWQGTLGEMRRRLFEDRFEDDFDEQMERRINKAVE